MNITYNNLQSASNLITFNDIPNILKVEDSASGTCALISLEFSNNLKSVTSGDGQWYITILGETITNVIDYNNAVNKNFYVSTSPVSTAYSVARALRNCPSIIANFTVENNDELVDIRARSVGSVLTNVGSVVKTSISNSYLAFSAVDGSANSSLIGALINVDASVGGDYKTTLTKSFYGGECAFNVSPFLTTITKIGEAVPYRFDVSYAKNGEYSYIGAVSGNYAVQGYMCNQGNKYLVNSGVNIAQNYSRGKTRGTDNNTLLYVYGTTIPLSFYNGNTNSLTINTIYRDSALGEITAATTTWTNTDNDRKLWDINIVLSQEFINRSFYVDIVVGSKVIRYNVIKPIKATEYYQRIYWRNSYGGISFFDFTGQKSETRDVEVDTYQKNIFDYYTSDKNELEVIYDNDVKYTVTLKSHLIENDGKYIFNDMMQSPLLWVERNGEMYSIIIESVSVEETDRNNIFEATVKYRYSQKPSLI